MQKLDFGVIRVLCRTSKGILAEITSLVELTELQLASRNNLHSMKSVVTLGQNMANINRKPSSDKHILEKRVNRQLFCRKLRCRKKLYWLFVGVFLMLGHLIGVINLGLHHFFKHPRYPSLMDFAIQAYELLVLRHE